DNVSLKQSVWWGTDHFGFRGEGESQDITANTIGARGELRARFTEWATGAVGIDANFAAYDVKLQVHPYPATDEVDSPAFARPLRSFDEQVWLVRPALYGLLELK